MDLFDIIDLIQAYSDAKLLKKILHYKNKNIDLVSEPSNKVEKFNIKYGDLNISISISFLKRMTDRRSKKIFKLKNKVLFDISLLEIENQIRVILHSHIIHTKEHLICKEKMNNTNFIIAKYLIK